MVGFQTKLKHGEQVRIFRTIPGLQNAEFARLGGLHRNTFLNSPKLLDDTLRLKANPRWRFAGQITGCEGYVESAAIGLLAARFAAAERRGEALERAAADHRAWRAARPHHRRPYRDHRRRAVLVPADEREFRPVPAARRARRAARAANSAAARPRTWRARARSASARSPISSAGLPASCRPPRRNRIKHWKIRLGSRAARHSCHCRRQGDNRLERERLDSRRAPCGEASGRPARPAATPAESPAARMPASLAPPRDGGARCRAIRRAPRATASLARPANMSSGSTWCRVQHIERHIKLPARGMQSRSRAGFRQWRRRCRHPR